jgi:hypothetical protein
MDLLRPGHGEIRLADPGEHLVSPTRWALADETDLDVPPAIRPDRIAAALGRLSFDHRYILVRFWISGSIFSATASGHRSPREGREGGERAARFMGRPL